MLSLRQMMVYVLLWKVVAFIYMNHQFMDS